MPLRHARHLRVRVPGPRDHARDGHRRAGQRGRRRGWRGPGDALADARPVGRLRPVPARRRRGLHGHDARDRHQQRGRCHLDRPRPEPDRPRAPGQRDLRDDAGAAGQGHQRRQPGDRVRAGRDAGDAAHLARSGRQRQRPRDASSSRSRSPTRSAAAPTPRRSCSPSPPRAHDPPARSSCSRPSRSRSLPSRRRSRARPARSSPSTTPSPTRPAAGTPSRSPRARPSPSATRQGRNFHNVVFVGAEPATCTPAAARSSPREPGWQAACRFDTPGTYEFVCGAHDFDDGHRSTATATRDATAATPATHRHGATRVARAPTRDARRRRRPPRPRRRRRPRHDRRRPPRPRHRDAARLPPSRRRPRTPRPSAPAPRRPFPPRARSRSPPRRRVSRSRARSRSPGPTRA